MRSPWRPKEFTDAVYDADNGLPSPARLLAVVLRDEFYATSGRGRIAHSELGRRSALGHTAVATHLKTLEDAGFITRKAPSKAGALSKRRVMTHYQLHRPEDAPNVTASRPPSVTASRPPHAVADLATDVVPSVTASGGTSVTASRVSPHRLAVTSSTKKMAARYARSAGAPRAPRPPRVFWGRTEKVTDPTPWDLRVEASDYGEPGHRELTVWPIVTAGEFFALPAADRQAADQSWQAVARLLVEEAFPALVAEVRVHHPVDCVTDDADYCCRISAGTADDWRDPIRGWDPLVWVVLPTEDAARMGEWVAELITEVFAEVGPHHPATEYVPTSTAPSEERREA